MNAYELNLYKAEVIKTIIAQIDDEKILHRIQEIIDDYLSTKIYPTSSAEPTVSYVRKNNELKAGCIPGLPYTLEERIESLRRAEAEDPSESITMEEFKKETDTW